MFSLLKLTLRERKLFVLAFVSSVFVAVFSSMFVSLIQPVIDEMVPSPAKTAGPADVSAPGTAPAAAPEKAAEAPASTASRVKALPAAARGRLLDGLWRRLGIGPAEVKRVLPLAVIFVFFGKGLFTFLSSFFMKVVGNKAVKDLRERLYGHILGQSSSFFDQATTGDLMSRLTNDVDRIQQAVGTAMSDLVEETFILLGMLGTTFLIDWELALMSFVVAPLAAVPMGAFSRHLKKRGRQAQARMGEIYNLIHETVTGNKIVKAFNMEGFELGKFLKVNGRYFRINLKLAWISALSSPFMEFLGALVGAFILFVGSRRIAQGLISPGGFVAFAAAIFMMFQPIKRLSRASNVVQQAAASYDRIQEILQTAPAIRDRPGAPDLACSGGRVRFEGVCFAYDPARPVLHDVSFEVPPNTVAALVGLSGAGKTTIVNLLARFYDPNEGRVLIDGQDVRDVTVASLRGQIGLVSQDVVLFNDTVRANIAYGLEVSPDRIVAAAEAAECHSFIRELPQGYETPIGERGGFLSAGQRQRLAIARALLKDPPILILDEATSALDAESERLIQKALAVVMKGRTTVVIAHRLSTIRNADAILVVDRGRIVESGPHDVLLKRRGIYRKLHDLQFPEAAEEEAR